MTHQELVELKELIDNKVRQLKVMQRQAAKSFRHSWAAIIETSISKF